MKLFLAAALFSFFVFTFSPGLMAEDYITDADVLFKKGGLENYREAISLYLNALKSNPDDYEANWKCARVYREYAEESKKQAMDGWKDICAEYGKKGMRYAEKAREQRPKGTAGHYYYGLNVGIYSDGVSIITALSEGLKGKTQESFEKAYELDKTFDRAGPILALGRFWAVLPWPFRDMAKALRYYREYQSTVYFTYKPEGKIYLAELLLQLDRKSNRVEAKILLEKASQSKDRYFKNWAMRILEEIK